MFLFECYYTLHSDDLHAKQNMPSEVRKYPLMQY